MASMQCHMPVEQTYTHVESTVISQKTTTETSQKANNEHSVTNKVKEMANSARKIFTEHKHQEHNGQNGEHHSHRHHAQHGAAKNHVSLHHDHESHATSHVQQSACQGSQMYAANAAANDKKKKEGHGGHFIANIGEHIKNMKNKMNHKAGKSSDGSSSDDESDKETSAEN
ncbi:uncharacterized protein [Coffea arabica]|uniref:Uncharacterized protein n=1 Tax=Coffea arabica TaxID=13443 RepID=A0A6P6U279_COFAR|nr:transcription initiation factor TFIID subunit 1-like [Coffea arabica]XP_027085594.1 transcription initiation factor TFIID subunit 1-like [Coffea arabica]